MLTESEASRFWSKVDADGDSECWRWKAGKNGHGYGVFKIRGRHLGAHRIAYQERRGEIPEGMLICHHCDNRSCCNPAHLFVGTPDDNAKDRDSKGRGGRAGVLRPHQVRAIRRALSGGTTGRELARRYGVTETALSLIRTGKRWAWLS